MQDKEKTIYDLKLHEYMAVGCDITVLRVPGGWIYHYRNEEDTDFASGVFVPYYYETLKEVK